ncbi:MAG: hypothetical protein Tsb0013_11780 [Phycisphaerales bacterium]
MLRSLSVVLACAASAGVSLAQPSVEERAVQERLASGMTALAIDTDLDARLIRVIEIDGTAVEGENGRGERVSFAPGALVALIRANPSTNAALGIGVPDRPADDGTVLDRVKRRAFASRRGVLTLVDGQRFPGTLGRYGADESSDPLAPSTALEDVVVWLDGERVAEYTLEDIASIVLEGTPATVRVGIRGEVASDTLYLTNGDVIEGFLASLGERVELERNDGDVTGLAIEAVHAIVLANPSQEPAPVRAWFDDGAMIASTELFTRAGQRIGVSPSQEMDLMRALASCRGVTFVGDRLVALSALDGRVRSEGRPLLIETHPDDALMESSPLFGASDVVLPGPTEVAYTLPEGAQRFACSVMLERPDSSWADCEVVFLVDGEEVVRIGLAQDTPTSGVRIDFPEGSRLFSVRVEEGRHGSVHDRVRLARPLVLLDE